MRSRPRSRRSTTRTERRRVHAARIAAKRVRYLLDPVKHGVPEARAALKLLKSLQDDFGELHDLHVARNELDSGVIERAAYEATERSREILDAAGEGRVPRRIASKLAGFLVGCGRGA